MSSFDVQHQQRAYDLVQRALSADRMPHAYLFHGPDGVGKETFAQALAALLLCSNRVQAPNDDGAPRVEACGQCDECATVKAGTHPDLHLIYRQLIKYHEDPTIRRRRGRDLSVEVIRQFVIEKVGSKPIRGRAKVFVIREADRITIQAQNALLKTLEEPPETTFLILLVSSLDRLLPTTRSRCHLTPFGALPDDFITAELQRRADGLSPERARLIARFSQGSLGQALEYAEDRLDERNDQLVQTLIQLPARPVAEVATRFADQAALLAECCQQRDPELTDTEAQRRGLKTLFGLAATWYRDVLHTGVAVQHLIANAAHSAQLATVAKTVSPGQATAAINRLAETEGQLDANVNLKLCLDALVIRLAQVTAPRPK